MASKIFNSTNNPELVGLILAGRVGVIPTDTVYGLVAAAIQPAAVERLYRLKERRAKPGTVIAADSGQLAGLGIKTRYLKSVEQFWPGPVSIILPVGQTLSFLTQGLSSLAVRVVDDSRLKRLLKQTGALLTTSANWPGQPTAVTLEQAKTYFNDRVDFYVDGGDLSAREPSTIIRIIDDAIEIIRPGSVKIEENGRRL